MQEEGLLHQSFKFHPVFLPGSQDILLEEQEEDLPADISRNEVACQTLVVEEDGSPPTRFVCYPNLNRAYGLVTHLFFFHRKQRLSREYIGYGRLGAVYQALNLTTGQTVAVKQARLEGLREEEIDHIVKNMDFLKTLSHPSIVKYEGIKRDGDKIYIILE